MMKNEKEKKRTRHIYHVKAQYHGDINKISKKAIKPKTKIPLKKKKKKEREKRKRDPESF